MKIKKKQWELILPVKLEELWDFFSVPDNLNNFDLTFTFYTSFCS